MTNWYKIFKLNQSTEEVSQIDYYEIGHNKSPDDALWMYRDGRVEVVYRKDCNDDSICFAHMDQFKGTLFSLVYRGRYDGNTKKISLSKPVGMGQFREVPSGLIYKLNQIFPENTGISTYEFASSFREYKEAQQRNKKNKLLEQYSIYTDIGHGEEENDWISHDLDSIWISDLNGNNFHKADPINYDHSGLSYDVGLNMQTGVITGRYDGDKNIVSIQVNPSIATFRKFPNRLIDRLYKEFGNNITILDYSQGTPKVVI